MTEKIKDPPRPSDGRPADVLRSDDASTAREQRAAAEAPDAAALIAWASSSPLLADSPLSAEASRYVLEAALGLEADDLAGLDDKSAERALGRLRAIVEQYRRVSALATIDDLTGALRRGPGMADLQRDIDRQRRVEGKGIVVAFFDVDGLKRTNDTLGHAAGDEVLRRVVAAIRERLRSYDLVIRYGGDEFVCVLSDADLAEAHQRIADISSNVSRRTQGVSVSMGLAVLDDGDTAETLISRADADLYRNRARRNGRLSPSVSGAPADGDERGRDEDAVLGAEEHGPPSGEER
ncbi:MAG TPA: GGDEF domain-containing protein [Candidatus Sulfotelmatobacter sp.]|nr:GGDEF domain-containing protein [Candidatus Sulfotelmatobacter sp.]